MKRFLNGLRYGNLDGPTIIGPPAPQIKTDADIFTEELLEKMKDPTDWIISGKEYRYIPINIIVKWSIERYETRGVVFPERMNFPKEYDEAIEKAVGKISKYYHQSGNLFLRDYGRGEYAVSVTVGEDKSRYEAKHWAFKNIKGDFYFANGGGVWFKNENEAMLFKLTWR